jgi:hypothetical protein
MVASRKGQLDSERMDLRKDFSINMNLIVVLYVRLFMETILPCVIALIGYTHQILMWFADKEANHSMLCRTQKSCH